MQIAAPKSTKSGHAAINGVNYYYAVYQAVEKSLLAALLQKDQCLTYYNYASSLVDQQESKSATQ